MYVWLLLLYCVYIENLATVVVVGFGNARYTTPADMSSNVRVYRRRSPGLKCILQPSVSVSPSGVNGMFLEMDFCDTVHNCRVVGEFTMATRSTVLFRPSLWPASSDFREDDSLFARLPSYRLRTVTFTKYPYTVSCLDISRERNIWDKRFVRTETGFFAK